MWFKFKGIANYYKIIAAPQQRFTLPFIPLDKEKPWNFALTKSQLPWDLEIF